MRHQRKHHVIRPNTKRGKNGDADGPQQELNRWGQRPETAEARHRKRKCSKKGHEAERERISGRGINIVSMYS